MADFAISDVFKTIDELAPQYGIDPGVAKSLIIAENTSDGRISKKRTFSGSATNQHQTMGIGQVIPTTARGLQQAGFLRPDWKFDPNDHRSQLEASLAAMKEMKGRQTNPDDPFELGAMYNGGNAAWNDYRARRNMNPETTQYLQKMRTGMAELNMTPQQIERAASTGVAAPGTRRSSSSSTSTTRNVFDDGAMENFQRSAGLLQAPGGLFDQAMNAVDARSSGVATQGADVIASILASGEAAGATASAQAMLKAAGEERRAAILSRANLHPEQEMNRMDQALRALDETSVLLEQKRPEIDRRMSVGFFDNPLEWMVNQVRLPGMIGEYNGLVGMQKDALQKYDAAKAITTSAIDMSQAIDADKTLEVGAAVNNEALKKAQRDADVTKLQLQQKSASDALAAVAIANQNVDLSLKQLMLTRQVEAQRAGESEAAARVAGEQAALSEFNNLVRAAGGNGIAYDRFKQMTPKAREEILSANSTGRFGGDFVSALKFVEKYGNLDNMAVNGQASVRTWINDTDTAANAMVTQAQTMALAKGEKNFNPTKAKEATFNTLAAQYEAAANGNMRGATEANPYKIAYKSIIATPDWEGNAFVGIMKKYGPDGTERQFTNYDEQAFLQRAVTTARLSGDPSGATKKLAADISNFYQRASKQQQMLTKPQMFGLSTPNKTYPVHLPAYSTGQVPKSLDLGNAVEVENFLTRQVAKETREQNPFSIAGARASSGRFGLPN